MAAAHPFRRVINTPSAQPKQVWCGKKSEAGAAAGAPLLLKRGAAVIIIKVIALGRMIPRKHAGLYSTMSLPRMPELFGEIQEIIHSAGLRPTRQRLALAGLLFSKGDRHVTAEALYEEARAAGFNVSLATVYNTLHQFTDAGLLRSIAVDTSKTYFDTNTGDHHHFFLEGQNEVVDMPDGFIKVENLPEPPKGHVISRVDVIVRVRALSRKS
jgi:Fur family transcriptional regulator, iron response regulator